MAASFSNFYGKTERVQILLKNGTRDFQNSPPAERLASFYVTISESFKRFQYFNFETNFLENENFLKKLEYRFLVETTNIENTSFTFKPALSEANVMTNRMVAKNLTYHKERSFASNHFIFLENLLEFQNLLKRVNLMYQRPKCPYLYFL